MSIKCRILILCLFLELSGLLILSLFHHDSAQDSLTTALTQQLKLTLLNASNRIEAEMQLAEKEAHALADLGEMYFETIQSNISPEGEGRHRQVSILCGTAITGRAHRRDQQLAQRSTGEKRQRLSPGPYRCLLQQS
jgi:hypothetical protein